MIREINGVRYICLSPQNESKFKEAAKMNRKDLRIAESLWRDTHHGPLPGYKPAKKSLKLGTILKVGLLLLALGILYSQQQSCIAEHGESLLCVD